MEMTTITIDRAVVEQALEALEYAQQGRECPSTTRQAITALRATLAHQAEPAQAISECIAVLRPMVKGKFPHEQALDELVGYTASPQRTMVPLTEKEMYAVDEEARKNFRLSQKGPRGQQITYWDGLTPWLIRAVERAHGIKE